jgi:hypothetical protein
MFLIRLWDSAKSTVLVGEFPLKSANSSEFFAFIL